MRKSFFAFIVLLITGSGLNAQSISDSTVLLNMFTFHVGGHIPGGDIANRYGMSLGTGVSYIFKTQKNWILTADFTYLSGNNFKEDSIFDALEDEYGDFINIFGEIGEVTFYERGFYTGVGVGKIFPIFGSNPNSGIMLMMSGGILQYKTLIHQDGNDIPSIIGEYSKGYDRLTNGFGLSEFIGYLYLDSHDPVNFYIGFEFHQAWTQNRRDWNFDIMGPDLTKRKDFLYGIRFGWIFPINKQTHDTYYFY
ncbi:MAG: hypothetical protein U9N86_11125 [Bacteroidota bacterium]|nr:hypothetical protein [Bacteroidota bacterium]